MVKVTKLERLLGKIDALMIDARHEFTRVNVNATSGAGMAKREELEVALSNAEGAYRRASTDAIVLVAGIGGRR